MSIIMGTIYLTIGLATTTTVMIRLYNFWESYARARKMLLIGYMLVMFAWTQRGIELIFFHAPGPRPIGWLAIAGALIVLAAFLMPEDKRLEPESWKNLLRKQEGDETYDKYMRILQDSAANRNISSKGVEHYKIFYEES